ncbi:hypothetical protein BBO99_00000240 [Phytophthora kernoviae]|uniref:BZIP domain-containing protein n=2 Tax=Phytophthora kernoviae TaxID=325452 RepID=A0A421H356_9STRA|nr:hypothetical protein G195_009147 [Phytophthora kernoviae 00238/432]KAG2509974.1 hypothetical protein JM16_008566 [Phytophthora kernoviae]KAG2530895.1 hypothetical protein JM18_001343 [Phytophthora kernoviae]RLN21328.1 hypothetical protein BBI17_000350 [Phytophthora kernoviae]RLN85707.1 hypothetical protein BBO99_00000240 [Phytophthora kernoviae]
MNVRCSKRPAPCDDAPPVNLKFMSNSERGKYYRRRRKLYGADLTRQVAELREEIAALTVSRQVQHELALSQRRTPLGAAAHIVSEYCSLFSHGAPVRLAVNEEDASAALVAQATSSQRGFLNAVMNDNVRFGEFLGVGLLLDQWERYSLYHAAIEWTMTSLDLIQMDEPRVLTDANRYDDGPLVVSITADLRVRFSRRTIEEIFPHLHGKVEWYAPEVDFVGALMDALKNPELVGRVMGHALIAKDHMIGDENDGRQPAVVVEEVLTDVSGSISPTLTDDSMDMTPHSWSSSKYDGAGVVSDDEPSHESMPNPRLGLAYILAD